MVWPPPRQPPQDSPGPAVWANRAWYYHSSTEASCQHCMMLVVQKACPCLAGLCRCTGTADRGAALVSSGIWGEGFSMHSVKRAHCASSFVLPPVCLLQAPVKQLATAVRL